MKKRLLLLLLALLLVLSLGSAAAWADNTILANLGTTAAGEPIDFLLGSTERGEAVLSEGELPAGCRLVSEPREGGVQHFLRGTPTTAGACAFTLRVEAPVEQSAEEGAELPVEAGSELIAEIVCSLEVLPGVPTVSISPDLSCWVGQEATVSVTASSPDGGALSYQWYRSASRSSQGGEPISGASEATLRVTPTAPGTSYYYCLVINTNNGRSVSVTSPAAAVTAQEVAPVSLTLAALPTQTEFTVGDALDTFGLQLRVSWSDGHTETVASGFTASPERLDSVGAQTVTVSYAGLSCSYTVQVKETVEVILELQIIDLPKKLEYEIGDWLDTTGMTLRVETNKGSHEVTTGFSCSPRELKEEGRQAITVSYSGFTATFYVEVRSAERRVESIVVTRRPAKLSYTVGEYFDPLGLTLTVQTSRGAEEVGEGYTWMPQQFTSAGRQTVTIYYEGKSCTLEILVDPPAESAAPTETAAPSAAPEPVPAVTARPDTHVERRDGHTAVVVIVVAALVGLASLVAYLVIAKKERLAELWAQFKRGGKKK